MVSDRVAVGEGEGASAIVGKREIAGIDGVAPSGRAAAWHPIIPAVRTHGIHRRPLRAGTFPPYHDALLRYGSTLAAVHEREPPSAASGPQRVGFRLS